MAVRHPSDRVRSLFGQLMEIEDALASNGQALLALGGDVNSASLSGELQEARSELQAVAKDLVREIEAHVEGASARAVFTGRGPVVDAL